MYNIKVFVGSMKESREINRPEPFARMRKPPSFQISTMN